MQRHFKIIFITFILIPTFLFATQPSANTIIKVANDKLSYYIEHLPLDMLKEMGCKSAGELNKIMLGTPFQLFSISPDSLDKYKQSDSAENILTATTMWYVPVFNNEKPIAMIIVDKMDEKWKAVSFGHFKLSCQWNEIIKQFGGDQFEIKLISMFQAKTFLFSLSDKKNENLTPLIFQKSVNYKKSLMSLNDTIKYLKQKTK